MAILSSKLILQRIFKGITDLDKLKESLCPNNSKKITDEKFAEIIIKDKEKRRKFIEIFNSESSRKSREKIGEIAEDYRDYKKYPLDRKKELSEGNELPILFDSLDIEKIRPANLDLRLGEQYFVSREKYPGKLEKGDFLVIEPGDFAILTTYEYLYVPDDLFGFISLRYKYKKSGLINISGFHVDPGYVGRLLFSVYNSGPKSVVLKHKEPVFMIMYDKLKEPVVDGYGPGYENITVDLVSELIGYSISPIRLKTRIDSLELHLRIIEGIVVGLFIAIVIALIEFRK